MLGLMQTQPLLISSIIAHAARHHQRAEIVSRTLDGSLHRTDYPTLERRSRRLAVALQALGVARHDRVATLAWNGYRHLEAYYAVSGSGAVLHTLNPRLFPEQIAYITNHAEDQYLIFELTFLPLIEAVAQHCKTIKGYILMCDRDRMPAQSAIPNLMCY